MRFILFNIFVGVALIYLFNGGTLSFGDLGASIYQTKDKIAAWVQIQPSKLETGFQTTDANVAYGRNRTQKKAPSSSAISPKQEALIAVDVPASTTKIVKVVKIKKMKRVPEANNKDLITRSAEKRSSKSSSLKSSNVGPLPKTGPADPSPKAGSGLKLKAGTSMMSPSERRRELDALAEEMEMLYIKTFGG